MTRTAVLCASLFLGTSSVAQGQDVLPLGPVPPHVATGVTAAPSEEPQVPVSGEAKRLRLRPQWGVNVYGGWLTDDNIAPVLQFRATLFGNKLFAVGLSRRQARLYRDSEWGFEGQVAKHFGGSAPLAQDHWELNAISTYTWNVFPWDESLDTSMALGAGLSWASQVPPFEIFWKGDSRQTMAYLLFETAFSLPGHPHWAPMIRVHHRSAAYGLFADNMKGASNALTFGVKYLFGSSTPRQAEQR